MRLIQKNYVGIILPNFVRISEFHKQKEANTK